MKKQLAAFIAFSLLAFTLNTQISDGGSPASFNQLLKSDQNVPIKKMLPVDSNQLLK